MYYETKDHGEELFTILIVNAINFTILYFTKILYSGWFDFVLGITVFWVFFSIWALWILKRTHDKEKIHEWLGSSSHPARWKERKTICLIEKLASSKWLNKKLFNNKSWKAFRKWLKSNRYWGPRKLPKCKKIIYRVSQDPKKPHLVQLWRQKTYVFGGKETTRESVSSISYWKCRHQMDVY